MGDGSNVRTKVAQYFVNKKHEELRSRKATLHNHDLSLLQYLPPLPANESAEEQLVSDSEPSVEPSVEPPVELPPFFPPTHHVPWEDMLERYKEIQPVLPEAWPIVPPWYRVAIIGAGVAGLRTAMLLQYMRIPYKIFEASDRPGGRVFTYQFASRPEENPQGKHDYYDVGAMRFPDNDANQETFKLFEELGIQDKVIPYVMSIDENIRLYNGDS
jgi:Flavin containing amine oxidoreductase